MHTYNNLYTFFMLIQTFNLLLIKSLQKYTNYRKYIQYC